MIECKSEQWKHINSIHSLWLYTDESAILRGNQSLYLVEVFNTLFNKIVIISLSFSIPLHQDNFKLMYFLNGSLFKGLKKYFRNLM